MRPHQTHPSLLRNIHPPIPKQGFLLPQSLVYVVLLRACDSGLVPVGWAVVAGQEQDLHGLGGGDGGPQAEDAGAQGLDAGSDPVLRAVDEVREVSGVDEEPAAAVDGPPVFLGHHRLRPGGDGPQEAGGLAFDQVRWRGRDFRLRFFPGPHIFERGNLKVLVGRVSDRSAEQAERLAARGAKLLQAIGLAVF